MSVTEKWSTGEDSNGRCLLRNIDEPRSSRRSFDRNDEKIFLVPSTPTIIIDKFKLSMKKRKRRQSDIISVYGLNSSTIETKKKKRILKVESLISLLSPAKAMNKFGTTALQKSLSGVHISSPKVITRPQYEQDKTASSSPNFNISLRSRRSISISPSQFTTPPRSVTPKRKWVSRRSSSRLWSENVKIEDMKELKERLSKRELRRQESIYELYQGEVDMVEDLDLVTTTYRHSLLHLGILSVVELRQIFGRMHTLLPLHQDLSMKLAALKNSDSVTDSVGEALLSWVPGLKRYTEYCSNLVYSKEVVDSKRALDSRFQDFLQRCLESPFSRKLDLWSFLDVPRSRLVKYPLLMRNILKSTPEGHIDVELIPAAIKKVEEVIMEVDRCTGETKCSFYMNKLYHVDEQQLIPELETAQTLTCSGVLRNNRGTKLHTFLFDTVLVLTRAVVSNKDHVTSYQVYKQPIPTDKLVVEVLTDGQVKIGSFKSAFSSHQISRNLFKVVCKNVTQLTSYILQANDEHDKKQWLMAFERVSSGIVYPEARRQLKRSGVGDGFNDSSLFAFNQSSILRPRNRNSVPLRKCNKPSLNATLGTGIENIIPEDILMSSVSMYV
ncbi:ARHGEF3 (predicted) [Pycnogonum litorale]